jgi:hypothetical protein
VASNAPAGNAATPAAPPPSVDVTAILDGLAAKNSEKLDWKKSIVDLLKLVGMDSSLAARKELAESQLYWGQIGFSEDERLAAQRSDQATRGQRRQGAR